MILPYEANPRRMTFSERTGQARTLIENATTKFRGASGGGRPDATDHRGRKRGSASETLATQRQRVVALTNQLGVGRAALRLRLELLRDLLPGAARIAVLVNPADASLTEPESKEVTDAARTMGLQIQVHNANTSAEINAAFEAIARERPDAVAVASTPFLNGRQVQLAQLAAFHRLPTISNLRADSLFSSATENGHPVTGTFGGGWVLNHVVAGSPGDASVPA
jgi:hypothetical protein